MIEKAPEYEVIKKDKKQCVFRKESMQEMFSIFLKESRSWIQSIRTIVQPIRHDIFKHKNSFDGNLMDKKQDEDISPFLLSLTSMLVDGEINTEGKCSQAALTVAGLITYNIRTIKRPRITNLDNRHHDKEKETSINIHVGLKLYSTVRSRTLIDCLFQLGVCISYDTHFHDTGISLFQLFDHENQGESLDCHGYTDAVYNIKKLAPLPAEYTQPRKVYHSSEVLFAPLCRFNYEDLFEYPELNLAKTELAAVVTTIC